MATPLIRTLQVQGGTFYAFTSSSRDLSKTLNNDQLKFQFSRFACLNIPDIDVPNHKENFIQFRTIDGAIFNGVNSDNNINVSESFQNYALNLETLILSDDDYNSGLKKSISERVFFKWLKELGAIRFRNANNNEANPAIDEQKFVEEDSITSGQQRYQRVVEYIGNIDVTNNVQKAGQSYTEIYLNVPTRVGNTPTVLFQSYSDDNYQSDMIIKGDNEFIDGRNSSTVQPDGLSVKAFYDYDAPVNYTDPNANWHDSTETDSYYTEPGQLNIANNVNITKTDSDYPGAAPFSDIKYVRSTLDGISLDFNDTSYTDIVTDANISTIQEYNSTTKAANFDFNCILVYYDLYDTSNPDDRETNLYGVLFLDNVTQTLDGGYFDRLTKYKPNDTTGLNGNSWSLTLNLKFDTSVDNAAIETIINEYSTFSMDLFIDASTKLQEATKTLTDTQSQFLDIINKVNSLENLIFSSENVTEIKEKLTKLENNVESAGLALTDSNSLLDLISKNSDTINDIINGTIPVDIQYNTDVLRSGNGIKIDKSVPNKIKIENNVKGYNLNSLFEEDFFQTIINSSNPLDLNQNIINSYILLNDFKNMIRFNTENNALSDINIYIDDIQFKFADGQTVRFVWESELLINGKNLIFYSDKINRFGDGELNKVIGTISTSDLLSEKPIFELTCINSDTYEFVIDIIR